MEGAEEIDLICATYHQIFLNTFLRGLCIKFLPCDRSSFLSNPTESIAVQVQQKLISCIN